MKKVLFILLFAAIFSTTKAQNREARYQGEVQAGFAIAAIGMGKANIHTVHGVRSNQYFFIGAGTGLDFYFTNNASCELMLPLYLNANGYLPLTSVTSLFLSLDAGYSIGLSDGYGGFYLSPALGVSFRISPKGHAITFRLRYSHQSFTGNGEVNTVGLGLGFTF